jgi:hypothetical protein
VLKDLKGYVQNMCKLEGKMAEGYIFYEALGFYTKYMEAFTTTKIRVWDVSGEEGVAKEVLEGMPKARELNMDLQNIAHLYVCENPVTISPWLKCVSSTICIILVSKFKHYFNSLNHGMHNFILRI